jgi:hypothetical protein
VKTRGREVLYALRDREREGHAPAGVAAFDLGQRLGRKDGRSVTPTLEDMARVGLVERADRQAYWRTTERGREVEQFLSDADAKRGGEFAPLVDLPLSDVERWVVAR